MRRFSIGLASAALLLVACTGGDDDTTPTATAGGTGVPVATATPLARLPEPIIVTGDGAPSGGSSDTEDAVTYVVESGDTVGLIAERFGVPEDVIREANDLGGDDIFVGQTLTIPRGGDDGGGTGGTSATATPSAPAGTGGDTYTVQEGDTAFGIALQFDITVEDLEAANDVGPGGLDNLSIGQVINLP